MSLQRLYESGKITYMRTDSVNLSDDGLESSKKEIISSFGKNILIKKFQQWGAKEATA